MRLPTKLEEEVLNCRKSNVQSYECSVMVKTPFDNENYICPDACLIKELFWLWDRGIKTTGCCCGKHSNCKKNMSYIGVEFEYINKMKELGYEVAYNQIRHDDEDSFIPKTFKERYGD